MVNSSRPIRRWTRSASTATDGCGVPNSGADDAADLTDFSSRGPVDAAGGDGRFKPEVAAPGTHVQAGVPQSDFAGTTVCNAYWPAGQTLYGWSSGTSHAAPAVAGAAALVRQDFLNQGLSPPSPAMVKAVLLATAEYMDGHGAGGTLPSNDQGFGRLHLERAFDGVPRVVVDQSVLLGSTGSGFALTGAVADPARPLRVTLVWTDAPGPTTGAAYVNDLDLTVVAGGATYLGNVFSGASSAPGGAADFRNNAESVFLSAGTAGAFTVTVSAASVGGDGVPGNGDSTDQDFALLVYNGTADAPPVGTLYGAGTPGSLGVPVIGAAGQLVPGLPLAFSATGLAPGTGAFFALSIAPQAPALDLSNGLLLNVALPLLLLLPETADGAGEARVEVALPAAASGLALHAQAFALDGTGGDDFASTQGIRVDLP